MRLFNAKSFLGCLQLMQAQKFYFIYLFKNLPFTYWSTSKNYYYYYWSTTADQTDKPSAPQVKCSSWGRQILFIFWKNSQDKLDVYHAFSSLPPPPPTSVIHSACVFFLFPIIIWSTTRSDALIDQQQGPEGRLQWSWSSVSQVLEGKGVIWFKWSEFFKPKLISCMAMRMLDSLYYEGNYKTDSLFCTFLSLQKIPFEFWMMSA
jgi:hypothetical protein